MHTSLGFLGDADDSHNAQRKDRSIDSQVQGEQQEGRHCGSSPTKASLKLAKLSRKMIVIRV